MKSIIAIAVALMALAAASSVSAQEEETKATVVGFSADGKVALVRWQQIENDSAGTDAIAIVRLDLAASRIIKHHDVVTRDEIKTMQAADYPKQRGARWTALEKQLKSDGYKVDPSYKELPRTGPAVGHGVFTLPDGTTLEEVCKKDAEDLETCDFVAKKGGKSFVIQKAIVGPQMTAIMSMDYVAHVYVDPASKYLIVLDRWVYFDKPKAQPKAFDLAPIQAGLK
jgi:hypothetical protein